MDTLQVHALLPCNQIKPIHDLIHRFLCWRKLSQRTFQVNKQSDPATSRLEHVFRFLESPEWDAMKNAQLFARLREPPIYRQRDGSRQLTELIAGTGKIVVAHSPERAGHKQGQGWYQCSEDTTE